MSGEKKGLIELLEEFYVILFHSYIDR